MDAATITSWMREIDVAVRAERDHLVQLDAAIGDGDHGTNMVRGFEAVVQALGADDGSPPGKLLVLAGRTLVSTVGGASGPLWGSALRSGGRVLGEQMTFEGNQLVEVLSAALASVKDLGTAAVGDKTMVDALEPAVDTLRSRLHDGVALDQALDAAAAAAEAGMRSTVPLQARKGRASYLGERSVGHQDPVLPAGQRVSDDVTRPQSRDDRRQAFVGIADVNHDRKSRRGGGSEQPVEDSMYAGAGSVRRESGLEADDEIRIRACRRDRGRDVEVRARDKLADTSVHQTDR